MRQRMQVDSRTEARRRYEQWRKFRGGGGRIPHEVWMAAAEAAADHGAEALAADLGVQPGQLRHWMRSVDGGEREGAAAAFVELPPLASFAGIADAGPAAECTLEFEEPSGRKLRISLRETATAQALELGRVLWEASP